MRQEDVLEALRGRDWTTIDDLLASMGFTEKREAVHMQVYKKLYKLRRAGLVESRIDYCGRYPATYWRVTGDRV